MALPPYQLQEEDMYLYFRDKELLSKDIQLVMISLFNSGKQNWEMDDYFSRDFGRMLLTQT